MRHFSIFKALIVLLSLVSCESNKHDKSTKYDKQTAEYTLKNPSKDAQDDYKKADLNILAVLGVGTFYPGLDQEVAFKLHQQYGSRTIEGTSDVIESKSHANYIRTVTDYAKIYNKTKVKLIRQSETK